MKTEIEAMSSRNSEEPSSEGITRAPSQLWGGKSREIPDYNQMEHPSNPSSTAAVEEEMARRLAELRTQPAEDWNEGILGQETRVDIEAEGDCLPPHSESCDFDQRLLAHVEDNWKCVPESMRKLEAAIKELKSCNDESRPMALETGATQFRKALQSLTGVYQAIPNRAERESKKAPSRYISIYTEHEDYDSFVFPKTLPTEDDLLPRPAEVSEAVMKEVSSKAESSCARCSELDAHRGGRFWSGPLRSLLTQVRSTLAETLKLQEQVVAQIADMPEDLRTVVARINSAAIREMGGAARWGSELAELQEPGTPVVVRSRPSTLPGYPGYDGQSP